MSDAILYDYWRSSASYRVRIALHLAGVPFRSVSVDLLQKQHKSAEHLARNPQGLVPALEIDGVLLTQSLAIIEYLNETRSVLFLPVDPNDRARVRGLAYAIAMDIHPVCNMGVVAHVMDITRGGDEVRSQWMKKFISEGLLAAETMLRSTSGTLCFGESPTLADVCLVPQVYNAIRWEIPMTSFPRITEICKVLENNAAFAAAHPDFAKP